MNSSEFTKDFFDDASKQWMKNKRKVGSGYYVYTCEYIYIDKRKCSNDCYSDKNMCKRHYEASQFSLDD
jgi:hypothetical protein